MPRSNWAGTCAANLAADEALLRRGVRARRVAVLADRALSVGVGVAPSAPYLVRAQAAGLPVVRRSTGGTGVIHGAGDLAWSIVLPRDDPTVGRDFVRAYGRLGRGVVRFLGEHGLSAEWAPPPGIAPDYCLLSGRGQVLALGDRILGGAAQHLSRTALLHHGIVPLDVDRESIARVFGLTATGAGERLTSLRGLGITDEPEALAEQLDRAIAREA